MSEAEMNIIGKPFKPIFFYKELFKDMKIDVNKILDNKLTAYKKNKKPYSGQLYRQWLFPLIHISYQYNYKHNTKIITASRREQTPE